MANRTNGCHLTIRLNDRWGQSAAGTSINRKRPGRRKSAVAGVVNHRRIGLIVLKPVISTLRGLRAAVTASASCAPPPIVFITAAIVSGRLLLGAERKRRRRVRCHGGSGGAVPSRGLHTNARADQDDHRAAASGISHHRRKRRPAQAVGESDCGDACCVDAAAH